jgi:hypothetical protein
MADYHINILYSEETVATLQISRTSSPVQPSGRHQNGR